MCSSDLESGDSDESDLELPKKPQNTERSTSELQGARQGSDMGVRKPPSKRRRKVATGEDGGKSELHSILFNFYYLSLHDWAGVGVLVS